MRILAGVGFLAIVLGISGLLAYTRVWVVRTRVSALTRALEDERRELRDLEVVTERYAHTVRDLEEVLEEVLEEDAEGVPFLTESQRSTIKRIVDEQRGAE